MAGGKAGAGGTVAVTFPPGRITGDAAVVVAAYGPPDATAAAVTAEQEALRKALRQAGVAAPASCTAPDHPGSPQHQPIPGQAGDPLPCPPPVGAIGVYVAVDAPLAPGSLPVVIDLVGLRRGWDGQGPPPWEGDAAGWTETQRRAAIAADRLLRTFAAIDARPDAAAWRQALQAGFGLALDGRWLTVDVPLGEAARTDGTARIEIVGASLLGAPIEVTVVSPTAGPLPPAARPATMPPPAGGVGAGAGAGTGTGAGGSGAGTGAGTGTGTGGGATAYRLRGDTTMGGDGGSVLLSFGLLPGSREATLIGPDGASLAGPDVASLIGADGATLQPREGAPLIGADGASLIGFDGTTLLGPDGATLIGPDGASLIGPDGATLIGPDGASLVGPDGATLVGADGGSLVAGNAGGAFMGQVRVPFAPENGAKYRLAAYTDFTWPGARLWAMNGLGQPYAPGASSDGDGAFTLGGMESSLSGVVIGAAAGPYRLFALAKAPGAATRQVSLDAATTAATCIFLADALETPTAIRPVDLDRYQALVAALRAGMTDADAKYVVSHPIRAVATYALGIAQAHGIPPAVGPLVSTFAGTPTAEPGVGGFVGGDMSRGQGRFWFPSDVMVEGTDLLVADNNNRAIQRIRLADAFGSTELTSSQQVRNLLRTPAGTLVYTTGSSARLYEGTPPSETLLAGTVSNLAFPGPHVDGPAASARLGETMGLALGPAGEYFFADYFDQRICKLAGGTVTTVAGANDVITDFADGPVASARFTRPYGLLFEPDGDLLVTDTGARRVRVLRANGTVATIAGSGLYGSQDGFGKAATFDRPLGMARDAAGNIYVCDGATLNGRIRKITTAGLVLTIAGGRPMRPGEPIPHADGPGSSAMFHDPHGLVFGPRGELYVADSRNHVIRKIEL
jgi:hypothetical protein